MQKPAPKHLSTSCYATNEFVVIFWDGRAKGNILSGQRTKVSNISSWLSPAGVITGGRFAFRMFFVFAMIILSMLVLGLNSQAENETLQNVVDGITAVFLLVGLPIAIWIILVSLAKHYRTTGVWAPFFFALITPLMPFIFFSCGYFHPKNARR